MPRETIHTIYSVKLALTLHLVVFSCFNPGGSGKFGLWMDENLYHGHSVPCDTFQNEALVATEKFIIESLECWSFVV